MPAADPAPPAISHGALFLKFLRFGLLAFGGPVAQIAMIRRHLVEEQHWISGERFNRLLAVMQVLPGPEAHELCVHLGVTARGRLGGLLAGLGFMLPGFILMLAVSWLYFAADLPGSLLAGGMLGMQTAVVAIIALAAVRIGRHVLVDRVLWTAALVGAAAALLGVSFWLILPAAGAACALTRSGRPRLALAVSLLAMAVAIALAGGGGNGTAAAPLAAPFARTAPGEAAAWVLFLSGLKAGLLTFGGAYTAIPFMRDDVGRRGWTGDAQFLDAVALAQIIPAPLIIFATFVGYAAGGFAGAFAITLGVFLPAFAFSLIFYDRLEAVVSTAWLHAVLDGVAAGVVGLIAATTLQLAVNARHAVANPAAYAAILALALLAAALWRHRLATPAILLAAGGVGLLLLGPRA